MPYFSRMTLLTALVCLLPAISAAQGRTTGQINGTVKDASGAVVPKAEVILIDNGTGATAETRSGADGNFTFPNLQPGRYQITATLQGFNPVTIQEVIVQTARSVDLVVQFEVQGLKEQVTVEGRSQVVETTSTTISNTVGNEQIAKLPLAGRNVLNFALLVPGASQSAERARQRIQRPAGRRDQHHARRHQQQLAAVPQRRHELLHVRPDSSRRDRRSDRLHRRTGRRGRRRRRGPGPVRDEARHQRLPRRGVRPVSATTR